MIKMNLSSIFNKNINHTKLNHAQKQKYYTSFYAVFFNFLHIFHIPTYLYTAEAKSYTILNEFDLVVAIHTTKVECVQ